MVRWDECRSRGRGIAARWVEGRELAYFFPPEGTWIIPPTSYELLHTCEHRQAMEHIINSDVKLTSSHLKKDISIEVSVRTRHDKVISSATTNWCWNIIEYLRTKLEKERLLTSKQSQFSLVLSDLWVVRLSFITLKESSMRFRLDADQSELQQNIGHSETEWEANRSLYS